MTTLHIEHPISDYGLWSSAFEGFAEARAAAGVRSQRVSRPVDDEQYVIIDLEFGEAAAAEQFLEFLRSRVWSSPASSPALAGAPMTVIFEADDQRAAALTAGTTRR